MEGGRRGSRPTQYEHKDKLRSSQSPASIANSARSRILYWLNLRADFRSYFLTLFLTLSGCWTRTRACALSWIRTSDAKARLLLEIADAQCRPYRICTFTLLAAASCSSASVARFRPLHQLEGILPPSTPRFRTGSRRPRVEVPRPLPLCPAPASSG